MQLRPEIPTALPPGLASICFDLRSEDREPGELEILAERTILAAYAADNSPGNRESAVDFGRILGRSAVETLDLSEWIDVPPTSGKNAGLRERRGVLSEIPAILQPLLPGASLGIEFEDRDRAVVRLRPTGPTPIKTEHSIFERDYIFGMLEEFLARCGWSKTITVDVASESEVSGQPAVALTWTATGGDISRIARDLPAEEAVVRKSAELLRERKELLTAVDYLHLANTELERQIRMNKRELEMARNIQKGFVPRRIPDWKGLQFWVKFYPMAEVSGDFYDYFTLGSNKLGIMVCDVSGHGVPAALISAIAKLSFKSHNLDSPAEVFNAVNLDLLNYVKKEGYLTCFYMIINSENEIVYSVGAAPPPMLLRAKTGAVEKLAGKGTLLGMFPDAGKLYEDCTTRLEPGDKLFVFTDGLTEARNRRDEFMDEAELVRTIQETRDMDVQRACEHVMEYYDQFTVGRDVDDDLTLITMVLSEREEEFNAMVREARKKHNDGQLEEACELLREATQIFPRHTPSLFLLGKYLFQARRFGEAADYLNQYNALKPYNADSYTILAECALLTKNVPLAIDHVKRSLSLRPENPGALYLAARIYDSVGRREEALEAFRELEHLRPRDHRTAEIRDLLDI
ncbi:MAG: SpoIIE family protein phosphatase [bacterium]|nr:SpoIIE family protein phosphatase [bacterium]